LAKDFAGIEDRFPTAIAKRFPHILKHIERLWPAPETRQYLDSLLLADRRERRGFNEEALGELFFLKQLHEFLHPDDRRKPWDAIPETSVSLRAQPTSVAELSRLYPPVQPHAGNAAGDVSAVLARPETPPAPIEAGLAIPVDAQPAPLEWNEIASAEALVALARTREHGETLPNESARRLGEILFRHGLLSEDAIAAVLDVQREEPPALRRMFGQIAGELGHASERDVIRALCVQAGYPLVDLDAIELSADALAAIPAELARQYRAVPVVRTAKTLFLAVESPLTFPARDYFCFYTNLAVELVCAGREAIQRRLQGYRAEKSAAELDQEFRKLANHALGPIGPTSRREPLPARPAAIHEEDATIIDLVNKMILDALAEKASDIHVEGGNGGGTVIRFRRDGRLERYSEFPGEYHDAVVSRLKIMADLDIAEKRKAQDGKIDFSRFTGERLEIRIATIPTVGGVENVTLRLLASGALIALEKLGLTQHDLAVLGEAIARPYGLMLVCGPTGSGKTTTLHSVLARLNTPERKIWTAEDPVEITQQGLNQVQVQPRIGWTFAQALRSFLRADPDVIMIGEMRDQETAKIAIEASMTGHLVLSTLHTNSAAETTVRLLDLGIDPFTLSDALVAILSQRLARKLCSHCKEAYVPKSDEFAMLASEYYYAAHRRQPPFAERERLIAEWKAGFGKDGVLALARAKGCARCSGTGYAGRVGIYELLEASDAVKALVRSHAPAAAVLATAVEQGGMHTLKQDGILKVLGGITDIHEVRAACV
jgi:type II secretory ATPase GspE/PulE/Tfp pilus assembly ATPase PilB-like protein